VGDLATNGPITIDIATPHRALAVGAHPDDVEFGCGATLAKWAAAGCRLHHLVLTDGSKGSWDLGADPQKLVSDREGESRTAADVIDGVPDRAVRRDDRVLFLGSVDGELANGLSERREVTRIIRALRPSVLLGHDPWRRYRLHPDHRAAGFLLLDALVAARDPHFFTELGLAPHRPEAVLLFEPDQPNHVEDTAGFDGTKIDALLCHRSQWLSTMGIDLDSDPDPSSGAGPGGFATKVRRQLGDHGALAGLGSAEAFHLIANL
jgi:LmbE family N-acetylglucosaminyl deacetylase